MIRTKLGGGRSCQKNDNDIALAKRLRNEVKDIIRRAKREFVQDEIGNDEHTPRKFWEKISYVLPSRDKSSTIRLINKNSGDVVDDESLPDYINRFFTDIGPNLAANFEEEWRDTIPNYEQEKMGNVEVDIIMMEKIVKDISIHKSSSVSNISSKVLKDAFMSMLPQLVFMYNLSFGTESFPDAWKIANVIPLKKGGGPH